MNENTLRKLADNPNYTLSEKEQKLYTEMMARDDDNRKKVVSHDSNFKINSVVVNKHSQELENE